jgi:hypothetical protein
MEEKIAALDDITAMQILDVVAKAIFMTEDYETELTPEMKQELEAELDISAQETSASEGDIAREALILLSKDPETRKSITALIEKPPPDRFGIVTSVALVTAALLALQTHVRFERTETGKIKVFIEKKPTSESLLKPLVQKVLSFVGG